MLYIILILILIISILFLWYIIARKKLEYLKNIPGPVGIPILGNVFDLGTNSVEQLKKLELLKEKYGSTFKLKIGPTELILFTTDPELCEFLLSSTKLTYKRYAYELTYPWVGQGLITSNGTIWHKQRKLLTSTFHFKILEQFSLVFNEQSKIFIDILENHDLIKIDLYPLLSKYTLDVICETAMGTSVNAQKDTENEYVKAISVLGLCIVKRFFSAWKKNDFLYKLFASEYNDFKNALHTTKSHVQTVIENRRQNLLKKPNQDDNNLEDIGAKKRIAFLDLLLQGTIDGQSLSNQEIEDQVQSFMFAGHDTTSSTTVFTLYALAKYPEIQKKTFEEISSICNNDDVENLTLEHLNGMKYLDCVIKESMRVYPPVPYIAREMENDTDYKGTIFPKGLPIFIFIHGLHGDPKVFNNPKVFDPDRYLDEKNMNRQNHFSFIPFSAGPRNCIGQKFAMYEMKTLLAKLIYKYEFNLSEPEKPLILSAELVANPAEPVLFNLKKRLSK